MGDRYYIKVGNCYVTFVGIQKTPVMRADHQKASPFLSLNEAKVEACKRDLKNYKIVKKAF